MMGIRQPLWIFHLVQHQHNNFGSYHRIHGNLHVDSLYQVRVLYPYKYNTINSLGINGLYKLHENLQIPYPHTDCLNRFLHIPIQQLSSASTYQQYFRSVLPIVGTSYHLHLHLHCFHRSHLYPSIWKYHYLQLLLLVDSIILKSSIASLM